MEELALDDGIIRSVAPLPFFDMPFDELREFAVHVDYEELYRNFDRYRHSNMAERRRTATLDLFPGQGKHGRSIDRDAERGVYFAANPLG